MTSTEEKPSGLFSSLKNSPATQRLMDQGKDYLRSKGGSLAGGIGNKVESATSKAQEVGEKGSISPVGEGAKRLAEGESPVKAAMGSVASKIKEKAKNLFGKGRGGSGNKKSMNIVESIDVGVPVSEAYNQWTQFQEFAKFMKGVESVEQTSETESNWRVKVFKSRRSWKANITEQIPDRRIVWSSEGPKGSTQGVVTFHPLADDLTRVLVSMRYYPQGLFEKTGNIWRAGGRRARLDLKNYRTYITSEGEASGSWRGEIHDGQVTAQPDDEDQQDQQEEGGEEQGQDRANGAQSQDGNKASDDDQEGSEDGQGSENGSGEQAQGDEQDQDDEQDQPAEERENERV
jgi:uncharacterized membrane protein